jgi:hypothetical protein
MDTFGLLLYFIDIWKSSWKFGIFYPVLVFCTKKNLATLPATGPMEVFSIEAKPVTPSSAEPQTSQEAKKTFCQLTTFYGPTIVYFNQH